MKIESIRKIESRHIVKAYDCEVGDGYLQGSGKTMSDVDIDFQSDRRQEVKEYLERCQGIHCGARPTSCPDQLAQALSQAVEDGRITL